MPLKFETNVPKELRLRFLAGKEVESQFGGSQHLFTAEEGTFYVSDTVGQILAEQIGRLGVRVGEPVTICKREVTNGGGRKSIQWQVERVGFAPGEQADGTFAVPKVEPVAAPGDRPKTKLEDALRTAVAAVYAAQQYARAIGFDEMPVFTSEDIRTMANTLVIQDAGGKRNAA
jgi:hypothetical protein